MKQTQATDLFTLALQNEFNYSIQYADYEANRWTVPVKLTPERYTKIMQDASITNVKLEIVIPLHKLENP